MLRSYLNLEAFVYLVIITVGFFIWGNLLATLIWFIFLAGIIFVFREKRSRLKDNTIQGEELLLSPVNARVIKITSSKETGAEIILRMGLKEEIGFYLPIDSTVLNVVKIRGRSISRFIQLDRLKKVSNSAYQYFVELQTKNKKFVRLRLYKCLFGLRPSLSILGGDLGKSGARLGFIPFGGLVSISFDSMADILIQENDRVVAGETLIARLR
jgi:phosphatidylserine decarboxylase